MLDQALGGIVCAGHGGLEVAHEAAEFGHLVASQHLDARVGLDLAHQFSQVGLWITTVGGVVDLAQAPAQLRFPLHQIDPKALLGQVQGGGHSRHSPADDQCLVAQRLGRGVEGHQPAGATHGHAGQVFGLLGGCLGLG